jgi:hypothetical protein
MIFFLILSIIALFLVTISSITLAIGLKKMKNLGNMERGNSMTGPLVTIVVPACNEEKNIENSILSLLDQDYKNLDIIIVNDRSTDNTAAVLAKLQDRFSRLHVHEITELPHGWMGKSHALTVGAKLAKGKYLVFTDADVILENTTITRAVRYMTDNGLDHLTLVFKNMTRGWLLNSLILDAGMSLMVLFRPWMARKKSERYFVGVGAFNMVKKSVYQKIGGHEETRMHPVDDVMLGKSIKRHGFSQDCLLAYEFVVVPWYDSVGAMIKGLEKNMFSLVHYRVLLIPILLIAIIVPTIFPVWGIIFGNLSVRTICLLTLGIRLATFSKGLQQQEMTKWYLPGCLITPYISSYIIVKAVFVTLANGGIIWRGQHYALAELRKAEPLFF